MCGDGLLEAGVPGLVGFRQLECTQTGGAGPEVARSKLSDGALLGKHHDPRRVGASPLLDDDVSTGPFAAGDLEHLAGLQCPDEVSRGFLEARPVDGSQQPEILRYVAPFAGCISLSSASRCSLGSKVRRRDEMLRRR